MVSAMAEAKPKNVTSFQKASLNVCAEDALGCAHSINIGGKTVLLSVDSKSPKTEATLNQMIANYQFHKIPVTAPFLARGYFAFERVFPNPTMEHLVFVVTDVDGVVLPR